MIIDLIQESQYGNQDATMKLIKTSGPTLRKYARALEIEDAYQDLQLDFIEVIQSIRCDDLNVRGDGAMVNYLSRSIRHAYARRVRNIIATRSPSVPLEETPDTAFYKNCACVMPQHSYIEIPRELLTDLECETIRLIHIMGYSAAEVAQARGVTRQTVNQVKRRAEHKLRKYLTETGQV